MTQNEGATGDRNRAFSTEDPVAAAASPGREESGGSGQRAKRIVIVGAGYAGAYCAAALERKLRKRITRAEGASPPGAVAVTVLDRHNYFIFYPLLTEAGTGALEPRHAVVSIRSFLRRATFHMVDVEEISFDSQVIRYRLAMTAHGESDTDATGNGSTARRLLENEAVGEMAYDHLVLCPGSVTLMPDIPGLKEHAFDVKNMADAVALRDHAIEMLELADASRDPSVRKKLLHFVVVGGSFTGAEVAGEFHAFLEGLSAKYPNLDPRDCRMTLIERDSRILRALSEPLARYAEKKMRERSIDIRLNETVTEVRADSVTLRSGEKLAACTTIWCAGIAPSPLIGRLDLPTDERGYVLCDAECRVRGFDNVWSIGDCAVNIDSRGNPYPATAQHAVREGRHLAKNLVRALDGRPPRPFEYATQGTLAALGRRTGVAEVFGFKLSGFPAWWLWRTVYLLKMPGLGRKVRVAVDWTLDLFFGREVVQLGVHRQR